MEDPLKRVTSKFPALLSLHCPSQTETLSDLSVKALPLTQASPESTWGSISCFRTTWRPFYLYSSARVVLQNTTAWVTYTEINSLTVLGAGSPTLGRFVFLRSWLPDSHLLIVSSHGHLSILTSSYKNTSHIALGLTHMTSFCLNYLFKGSLSKYSYILRLGLQYMNFESTQFNPSHSPPIFRKKFQKATECSSI